MTDRNWGLLLSCEHGGNHVPTEYQDLFVGAEQVLVTHRGYDLGIVAFARQLAEQLQAPLHLAEVTRLLVELNRSSGHPVLFSEFTRHLGEHERRLLLERYYFPYRSSVIQTIDQLLSCYGRVCHVSLHSFTPQLNGELRNADIGLLYDPGRRLERDFCVGWQRKILQQAGGWRVRRNYPYRGTADSFVTFLRRRYPAEAYLGLELELNQQWPVQGGEKWELLQELVGTSLWATFVAMNIEEATFQQ